MRKDDLLGYIAELEQKATGAKRKPKVLQRWMGDVVIPNTGVVDVSETFETITANKRWNIFDVLERPAWVMFSATYLAKGANADDCEKKIADAFGLEREQVRIQTKYVEPQ